MKDYIEERAINIAVYIIDNNATVRQTAKAFGVSKSTVHKDVTSRLMQVNPALARQARTVLDVNKSERHIRGGLATREKYAHQKKSRRIFPLLHIFPSNYSPHTQNISIQCIANLYSCLGGTCMDNLSIPYVNCYMSWIAYNISRLRFCIAHFFANTSLRS